MQIYWLGQACFRIVLAKNKQEPVRVVIDPFSSEIGFKIPSLEAEILLISHNHFDHNNIKAIKGNPFLITEPGEYEIKDVFIRAISSFHDEAEGKERGKNLIFTLAAEGLNLCHMGDFGQKQLTDKQLEKIGDIDILMIPVGGVFTIDGHRAQGIVAQIEPRLVIPMHYDLPGIRIRAPQGETGAPSGSGSAGAKLEGLDKFLKVMGQKPPEAQKKLKIKKKDLPEEETKIVVLEPRR